MSLRASIAPRLYIRLTFTELFYTHRRDGYRVRLGIRTIEWNFCFCGIPKMEWCGSEYISGEKGGK